MHVRAPETITLDAPAIAAELRANGAALSDAARAELLDLARAGKPCSLHIHGIAYEQGEKSNRNFVRFTAENMRLLEETLPAAPLQADHSRKIDDRLGTVKAGQLNGQALRFEAEVTEPRAVAAVLERRLDRFSIGVMSAKGPSCSICKEPMFSSLKCQHWPGTAYEGKTAEMLFSDARIAELSAVTIPAVEGAALEGFRASLAAVRAELVKPTGDAGALTVELAAEREAHTLTRALLTDTANELARLRGEMQQRDIDALVEGAISAGQLTVKVIVDGKTGEGASLKVKTHREPTPVETAIRNMAKFDMAAARALVASLPRVTGLGARMQSLEPRVEPPGGTELSAEDLKMAARLNLTPEEFARYSNPSTEGR